MTYMFNTVTSKLTLGGVCLLQAWFWLVTSHLTRRACNCKQVLSLIGPTIANYLLKL